MKVIYLSRYNDYHIDNELYKPGEEGFFNFGMGQFIAREFIKEGKYQVIFENWRADKRISEKLERNVDGLQCRIFPSVNLPFLGEFSWSLFRELHKITRNEKVVIHIMSVHVLVMYLYVLFTKNSNIVATHLGGANPFWSLKNRKGIIGKMKSFLFYQLEKRLFFRHFKHLITPCKDESDYYNRINVSNSLMPIFGIARQEIFSIENRENARKRLGLPIDKVILLQVGRAVELRGFDWIIQLVKELKDDDKYFFVFAGINKEDEYYSELSNLGVYITPYINHTDLPEFYNAADLLFYLPHGKMDLAFAGTSYVPLEAMLCGTPVVSTTFHHFNDPEVVELSRIPRSYNEIFPMMEDLLSANISRDRLRDIVLRNYNWKTILDKHYSIYTNG